jgi:hypothetical protein
MMGMGLGCYNPMGNYPLTSLVTNTSVCTQTVWSNAASRDECPYKELIDQLKSIVHQIEQ